MNVLIALRFFLHRQICVGSGRKKKSHFCVRVRGCKCVCTRKKKDKNRAALVVDGGRFGLHIG